MQLTGLPSLIFLAYLLLVLPWLGMRSAQRFRAAEQRGERTLPSRPVVWGTTLANQCVMFLFALLTGASVDMDIFETHAIGAREISAAGAALAGLLVLRAIARAMRSDEERRKMTVYVIAPRSAQEWVLWSLTVVVASVSEEAAYRGVGMGILWYSLGSVWAATLIASTAFAIAHAPQGWKSGVVIFGIALVMHQLVLFTNTLILAMIIHAVFDFFAGYRIAREAAAFDAEAQPAT